jgi:hypothetical protein
MTACKDSLSVENAHQQHGNWILWATLTAIVLSCAVALSLNLVDPDLWGHIRYGQDWLAEGQLPRSASHTFTAVGYPWINHENLAELALAEGYRIVGSHGLLAAKCLLGLVILAAMVRTASRAGVRPLLAWTLMLLVARNLTPFFIMRPQLLSFLWCALVLVALERAFAPWQDEFRVHWRWLWVVPIVMVVWVNSHGAFVAGLCLVGVTLAGRMVEVALQRGRSSWPTLLHLATVGLSCLAATLLNPYGLQLHDWLLVSLGQPRPEITEWGPPHPGDPVFWPLVALVLLAMVSLSATRRRRDWVQNMILAMVAWQAAAHLRHIPFFALLCGFWLPAHLESTLRRLRPSPRSHLAALTLPVWLRTLTATVLIGTIGMQSYVLAMRLTRFPVPRERFPVDAVQFMTDQGLGGKLVVCFNWAQYAIAALAPDVRVAFDGRFRTCYPQEVVDMHFDFLQGPARGQRWRSPRSGPVDGTRVLAYREPDLVLVDRHYQHAVDIMNTAALAENPEWVLLYRDGTADLWGRQQRYDLAASPHYIPPSARVLDPRPRVGALPWPALPIRKGPAHVVESFHEVGVEPLPSDHCLPNRPAENSF